MQEIIYDLRKIHTELKLKSQFMNWSKILLAHLKYDTDYTIKKGVLGETGKNQTERIYYIITVTEDAALFAVARSADLATYTAFYNECRKARTLPTTPESGKLINHLLTKLEDTLTTIPNLVLQELKHWHTSQKQREDKLLNLDYLHEYEAQLLANIASKIKLDPAILKLAEPFRIIPEQDKL